MEWVRGQPGCIARPCHKNKQSYLVTFFFLTSVISWVFIVHMCPLVWEANTQFSESHGHILCSSEDLVCSRSPSIHSCVCWSHLTGGTRSSSSSHAHTRTHMCTHTVVNTGRWKSSVGKALCGVSLWLEVLLRQQAAVVSCRQALSIWGAGISSKCLWNILKPSTLSPISCCRVVPYGKQCLLVSHVKENFG